MTANDPLREELLAMAAEDQAVRAEVGLDGYDPRMEEVHRRNAARLKAIIVMHGWPGKSLVGEDGAEAAWLVLQHAIGDPGLQRRGLGLLRQSALAGEIPAWQVAYLEDRIAFFEGRPQLYGTQYDWDEQGQLSPHPILNSDKVDERRRSIGLGSLEENTHRMRREAAEAGEGPPRDLAERRRQSEEWARAVGWRG
jgi:hypothetical protein